MSYKSLQNLEMSSIDIKELKDASELIKNLVKKYSKPEVIKQTGLDKNVIYRLENQQNVTLENFLAIKRAFPDEFNNNNEIGEIPIMGEINGSKVLPLNPSQPKHFNAPAKALEDWSPCIAYINIQPNAFTGTVRIFSSKHIDEKKINQQCFNRLIMVFPERDVPLFGVCKPNVKGTSWQLLDAYTGEELLKGKLNENLIWWRYAFTTSLYLMENHASKEYNETETDKWYQKIHKIYHD